MQPIQFTGAFVKNVLNQPAFYTQLEFARSFYDCQEIILAPTVFAAALDAFSSKSTGSLCSKISLILVNWFVGLLEIGIRDAFIDLHFGRSQVYLKAKIEHRMVRYLNAFTSR
jgi:hypothetical protein